MKQQFVEAVQGGLAGGILSCAVSGILNYFIIPFPTNILSNAVGHGIGGFFCGFISGLVGILIYARHINNRRNH